MEARKLSRSLHAFRECQVAKLRAHAFGMKKGLKCPKRFLRCGIARPFELLQEVLRRCHQVVVLVGIALEFEPGFKG